MFSTAALFDEATTISKPVSSGRKRAMVIGSRTPSKATATLPMKASPARSRQDSTLARRTMLSANNSRNKVVLPVPGGPLTEKMPRSLKPVRAPWMANCCIRLMA